MSFPKTASYNLAPFVRVTQTIGVRGKSPCNSGEILSLREERGGLAPFMLTRRLILFESPHLICPDFCRHAEEWSARETSHHRDELGRGGRDRQLSLVSSLVCLS